MNLGKEIIKVLLSVEPEDIRESLTARKLHRELTKLDDKLQGKVVLVLEKEYSEIACCYQGHKSVDSFIEECEGNDDIHHKCKFIENCDYYKQLKGE